MHCLLGTDGCDVDHNQRSSEECFYCKGTGHRPSVKCPRKCPMPCSNEAPEKGATEK
jgi:hypothetical protein